MTLDVGKPFTPPKRWGLKGDVRTRLGYQQTRATSFVVDNQGGGTSRLSDNGRRSVSLNADTDLSATAVFSLQGSRVVNFDNNFNRRFTQTVLSVVLQLNFFGGDLH